MKTRFHEYWSAGLLAGSLAALAFGLEARLNAVLPTARRPLWATLISVLGPAACLMLPGLLVKPSLGRLFRFVVGTFFGSLIIWFARAMFLVKYAGGPPPPWPDLKTFGQPYLVTLCLAGLLATFYMSGQPGCWLAKVISPFIACAALWMLATFLYWIFPPQIMLLEKWEYLTILIGGPLFGVLLWGPLNLKRKQRTAEPSP